VGTKAGLQLLKDFCQDQLPHNDAVHTCSSGTPLALSCQFRCVIAAAALGLHMWRLRRGRTRLNLQVPEAQATGSMILAVDRGRNESIESWGALRAERARVSVTSGNCCQDCCRAAALAGNTPAVHCLKERTANARLFILISAQINQLQLLPHRQC
jgi:hypothetical protein